MHEVTEASRGLVRMLVLLGCTQDEISAASGVDRKTLRKHYREDLTIARLQLGAQLMQTYVMAAQGGAKPNWEKAQPSHINNILNRIGFAEPVQRHLIGTFDAQSVNDEDLSRAIAILSKGSSPADPFGGEGQA